MFYVQLYMPEAERQWEREKVGEQPVYSHIYNKLRCYSLSTSSINILIYFPVLNARHRIIDISGVALLSTENKLSM